MKLFWISCPDQFSSRYSSRVAALIIVSGSANRILGLCGICKDFAESFIWVLLYSAYWLSETSEWFISVNLSGQQKRIQRKLMDWRQNRMERKEILIVSPFLDRWLPFQTPYKELRLIWVKIKTVSFFIRLLLFSEFFAASFRYIHTYS